MSNGHSHTTATASGALLRHPASLRSEPAYQDRSLRIAHSLSTSLEASQLLSLFHDEVRDLLGTAGVQFVNQHAGLDIQIAGKAVHSCQYQLTLEQEELGSVVFTRNNRFREQELALLEHFITLLLYPLRNSLLHLKALRMAERDCLTGMRNRVAMESSLQREIALGKRHQDDLSLLVLDIDNFKQVNDTYGHLAGDHILRRVAEIIMETVRQTDMSFRFGGEEFVVVLSKTKLDGAVVIGERLRQLVENSVVSYKKQQLQVTISVGATQLIQRDDLSAFFERADRALYAAKNNGRNRLELICGDSDQPWQDCTETNC